MGVVATISKIMVILTTEGEKAFMGILPEISLTAMKAGVGAVQDIL